MDEVMVDCAACGRTYNLAVLKVCPACHTETAATPELQARRQAAAAEEARLLRESLGDLQLDRVTTLQELPGFRTVRTLGLITTVQSASGLSAGIKGREAADRAGTQFLVNARRIGANAVLGVQTAAFGAGGGLTNVFGGDAVGILLIGTAAIIEPISEGNQERL